MLTFKQNILNKINNWNDNYYVLIDFDRTITNGDSETSWGVLSKSKKVPKEYAEDRKKLFSYYYPFEIDLNLDYETKNKLMIEWYTKHINFFIKYKLKESLIENMDEDLCVLKLREGAKEFFKKMYEKNIPVIILSAGIGNIIKQFLIKNDCLYENIYIVANFIKFENGVASGIQNNIIHSLNKNEISLSKEIKDLIKNKDNIILFGDNIDDIKMVSEDKRDKALKIGFLNKNVENNRISYLENFDIVCDDNTSFDELLNQLDIFK